MNNGQSKCSFCGGGLVSVNMGGLSVFRSGDVAITIMVTKDILKDGKVSDVERGIICLTCLKTVVSNATMPEPQVLPNPA